MSDSLSGEDLADLFDSAPCGYVSLSPDTRVIKANRTLAEWLGTSPDVLVGRRFGELLSFGGRIAFDTHLLPMLRLQTSVQELAFDMLAAGGAKIPVIANASEKRDEEGRHLYTRITLFRAVDRRAYEKGLLAARTKAEEAAASENKTSALREQFIAVLGHDLRNPLAALAAGVRMLRKRETFTERGEVVTNEMAASIARATALVENVLDFARGQLGDGLTLDKSNDRRVEGALEQVVDEFRAIAPDQEFVTSWAIDEPVECDCSRIAQLASNLIGNAVTHGATDKPIEIVARTDSGRFTLAVTNWGKPIPDAAREHLFRPFFRGAVRPSQQGLGLGLFIVNEIARAHGGSMAVVSDDNETRFTFSMPLSPPALG